LIKEGRPEGRPRRRTGLSRIKKAGLVRPYRF
jgi:hypothetical protein